MQPYIFTQDDMMNPVYCTQCRAHIPLSVSNAGRGLCPTCIASNQRAIQSAAVAQQNAVQQAQQALFYVQTGMGRCVQCGSTNIAQIQESESSSSHRNLLVTIGGIFFIGGMIFTCLCIIGAIPALVGLVMLIVGLCMKDSRVLGTSRVCNYCGCRWQV